MYPNFQLFENCSAVILSNKEILLKSLFFLITFYKSLAGNRNSTHETLHAILIKVIKEIVYKSEIDYKAVKILYITNYIGD